MPKANNWPFRKGLILTFSLVLLILVLDQGIKMYIKSTFSPGEMHPLIGDWFLLEYIENQGMAFGTTFGTSIWSKLALSFFRIFALIGILWYWFTQSKKGARPVFHIAVALVLAGAAGNLIDSMFYDFIFPYDPCMPFNHLTGSGNTFDCGIFGEIEVKHKGFLLGNVVDMFKFHGYWPDWMPLVGGNEIFPAIWNVADGAISVGVLLVFFNQKTFFPKPQPAVETESSTAENSSTEEAGNTHSEA